MEKHFAASKFSQVVYVFLDHPSIFHGTKKKKKKNVNVAPFGLGNPAVAANPSTVCNPTDVFTWRIPKVVERKQVLATSFGATAEFQNFAYIINLSVQQPFQGDMAVLILEMGKQRYRN